MSVKLSFFLPLLIVPIGAFGAATQALKAVVPQAPSNVEGRQVLYIRGCVRHGKVSSEFAAHNDLDLTRMPSAGEAGDLAKATGSELIISTIEASVIESVEGFQANLHLHIFPDGNLLSQSEIHVVDPL